MPSHATPRVEKGVKKVNEHQVKENAAILLFTLTKAMAIDDPKLRQHFLNDVASEVDTVVADFGFAKDRIRNEGDTRYNEIIAAATTDFRVAELKNKHLELGAIIKSFESDSPDEVMRESTESDETDVIGFKDSILSNDSASSTRSGPVRKRQKSVHEAFTLANDMVTTLHAMKSDARKTSRRRGSAI